MRLGTSDAVSLQLEITAKVPRGYKLTQELLDEVVRGWAEDGEEPRGFRIRIIDWKREGARKGRPTNQEEARERFRGLLQQGRFTVNLRDS